MHGTLYRPQTISCRILHPGTFYHFYTFGPPWTGSWLVHLLTSTHFWGRRVQTHRSIRGECHPPIWLAPILVKLAFYRNYLCGWSPSYCFVSVVWVRRTQCTTPYKMYQFFYCMYIHSTCSIPRGLSRLTRFSLITLITFNYWPAGWLSPIAQLGTLASVHTGNAHYVGT